MMFRLSPSVTARNRSASSAPARRRVSSSVPSPRRASPLNELGRRSNAAVVISRMETWWPPSSSMTASIAPTRPQPTITVRMSSSGSLADRLPDDPHGAAGVREHVRNGSSDGEVAAESLAIGQSQNQQVGGPLTGLIDQRGAHVARLEEDRLDGLVFRFGDPFHGVQDPLGILGSAGDIGLERQAPI